MNLELTDREVSIVRFALRRFAWEARNGFDAAAQRSTTWNFGDLDASKFLRDAKDAEAVLSKISTPSHGIQSEQADSQPTVQGVQP